MQKKNIVRRMELDGRASLNEECVEAFIKATNGVRRTASPVELLSFRGHECLEQHLELMRACLSLLVVQWYDCNDIFIDYKTHGEILVFLLSKSIKKSTRE